MYCRNCGATIEENAAVCLSCGVKAGDGNKYCPNCGAEPDPSAVVCVKCGTALKAQSKAAKEKNKTEEVKVVKTIQDAFKVGFNKYAVFSGRANKAEYWWLFLIFSVVPFLSNAILPILGTIVWLALIIPSLSVLVRRLHDTGKSGWYTLIALIPLAGPIILLIQLLKPSDEGDNEYGPNPNIE